MKRRHKKAKLKKKKQRQKAAKKKQTQEASLPSHDDAQVFIVSGDGHDVPESLTGQKTAHIFSVAKGEASLDVIKARLKRCSNVGDIFFTYWQKSFKERAEHYAYEVAALYPSSKVTLIECENGP